jgi:hypothetical protein
VIGGFDLLELDGEDFDGVKIVFVVRIIANRRTEQVSPHTPRCRPSARHGLPRLRRHRRRRPAELEGAASSGEPDRGAVAMLSRRKKCPALLRGQGQGGL